MILEMAHDDYLTLLAKIDAPSDATEHRRAMILARLHEGWNPSSIYRFLGCARATIYNTMEGAKFGRPRPTVRPLDPWPANERLAELIEVVEGIGPDEALVCQDEVDIHLNPKIGPMWMMQGQQPEVLTPGKNRKRYLAGSIDMRTGQLVWMEAERKNSDLFISWLRAIGNPHPEAPAIHVILDNYGIHTSKKTTQAVEALDGRIKLHFLPPYCPVCNFMEHVWLQLHANVTRNHRCPDMEALMQAVRAFMQAATPFPGSKPSLAKLAS